jgi:hypothetical protein
MSQSFHIFPISRFGYPDGAPPSMVPLAVTFYVTEEVFEDAGSVPHERLAELLTRDLTTAIQHYREHPPGATSDKRASDEEQRYGV